VNEFYDAFAPENKEKQKAERYKNEYYPANRIKRHAFLQCEKSKIKQFIIIKMNFLYQQEILGAWTSVHFDSFK